MKRILAAILALLMVLGSVMMFASCGQKPKLNLEKAEENLDDEDYNVTYIDDEDELGIAMSEKLTANDGKNEITIIKYKKSATAKLKYKELKLEYDMQLEYYELRIAYYEHLIKTFDDDLKSSQIDEYEDQIKYYEDLLEEAKDEYVFGRSGKYVWYGTADALKDTK